MTLNFRSFSGIFLLFLLTSCATIEPETVEQEYDQAIQHIDRQNYSLAIPLLESIIKENPGTRYATFAHLKMGDAYIEMGGSKINDAETNYRIFLNYNSNSHLVPYVLSRLIELNYKRNISAFFDEDYAYYRDPEHFKKIVHEYQRFFMLYPDSLYLKDARVYLDKSNESLAEHEFQIGRWYFQQNLFVPAIARFRYTLSQFPGFKNREQVVSHLITSYHKNQQPELAAEFELVYKQTFK